MVQRVRKAVEPPGEARDDSSIILELAKRLGYEMRYDVIEDVFYEAGKSGLLSQELHIKELRRTGLQWPCPTLDHPGTQYLFKGGFPRGKASFTVVNYRPTEELPDNELSVYTLDRKTYFSSIIQATMTRRIDAINAVSPCAYIEIHPDDAERLGVSSRRDGYSFFKERLHRYQSIGLGPAFKRNCLHPFSFQRGFCQCAYKYRC